MFQKFVPKGMASAIRLKSKNKTILIGSAVILLSEDSNLTFSSPFQLQAVTGGRNL
jgi:hypothetical protein